MKKLISVVFCMLFVFGIISDGVGLFTAAAYGSWQEAYAALLRQDLKEIDWISYDSAHAIPAFSLIYVNNDSIPELVRSAKNAPHGGSASLFTFYNGNVVDLGYYGSWGEFSYLERESYILSGFQGGGGVNSNSIYKMEGTEVKETVSFFDNIAMGIEPVEYKINDQAVSEQEYNIKTEEWLVDKNWESTGFDYDLTEANINRVFKTEKSTTSATAGSTTPKTTALPSETAVPSSAANPSATTKPIIAQSAATTEPALITHRAPETLRAMVTAPTEPDGSGTVQLDGQEYLLLRFEDFSYILQQLDVVIVQYLGSARRVEIPAEIDGTPVTGVADNAFAQSQAAEVVVPASVYRFGDRAFESRQGKMTILCDENSPAADYAQKNGYPIELQQTFGIETNADAPPARNLRLIIASIAAAAVFFALLGAILFLLLRRRRS